MNFEKFKRPAATVVACVGGVCLVAYANSFHQPLKNPQSIECEPYNSLMMDPPPPFPSPDRMAQILKVNKERVFYGHGGHVICNNVVSLGKMTEGIKVPVTTEESACVVTLEDPPTAEYKDSHGSNVFDVFCPAPMDNLPHQSEHLA